MSSEDTLRPTQTTHNSDQRPFCHGCRRCAQGRAISSRKRSNADLSQGGHVLPSQAWPRAQRLARPRVMAINMYQDNTDLELTRPQEAQPHRPVAVTPWLAAGILRRRADPARDPSTECAHDRWMWPPEPEPRVESLPLMLSLLRMVKRRALGQSAHSPLRCARQPLPTYPRRGMLGAHAARMAHARALPCVYRASLRIYAASWLRRHVGRPWPLRG